MVNPTQAVDPLKRMVQVDDSNGGFKWSKSDQAIMTVLSSLEMDFG